MVASGERHSVRLEWKSDNKIPPFVSGMHHICMAIVIYVFMHSLWCSFESLEITVRSFTSPFGDWCMLQQYGVIVGRRIPIEWIFALWPYCHSLRAQTCSTIEIPSHPIPSILTSSDPIRSDSISSQRNKSAAGLELVRRRLCIRSWKGQRGEDCHDGVDQRMNPPLERERERLHGETRILIYFFLPIRLLGKIVDWRTGWKKAE